MAVPESPYCSILWDQPENIVSPRVDTSPAFIHCLVHTSKTRCIRTISDMTEYYVASAYFCCWCFVVDSLVSFDLFSMQVTLLSFSVESESTFLDYIKGGWVERQTSLLSCCESHILLNFDAPTIAGQVTWLYFQLHINRFIAVTMICYFSIVYILWQDLLIN